MRTTAPWAALVLMAACSPSRPDTPPAAPNSLGAYRLDGPHARGNLTLYFLCSKEAVGDTDCVTLEEGLGSGVLRVTEKAQGAEVNELQVENVGDRPVYLQAGDTVKGGQQDRTLAADVVLPPKSGPRTLDAFCVEPGRWEARPGAAAASVEAPLAFQAAPAPVASKEQKLALKYAKSQEQVWEEGRKVNQAFARQSGGGQAADSFVLAVENPEIQKKVAEAVAALEKAIPSDAVGVAVAVNGKLESVDAYASTGLFRKLWPKLLRGAVLESLAKKADGDPKPVTEADVRAALAKAAEGHATTETRPGNMTVKVYDREKTLLFDTESEGKLMHRQLLTR
ncbi:MAG TPA: DUF6569 family protein [Planctomycetota bacterium]|nr:DUF6569 family protein [Planctomycetota bacterium]